MQVFVTGASGYIGSAVCEELRGKGYAVLGLVRREEQAALLRQRGDTPLISDLDAHDALREACRGADAVVHTAQGHGPDAGVQARAAVSAMLDALAGTRKTFLYTSGVWVMGDTRGRMLGEVSQLRPPAPVAWRPAVEELVLEAKERGVAPMVFRPGVVFGRKGGLFTTFFDDARAKGVVRIVGNGDNHWSCVHANDLAQLYGRALADPAPGELFIACGGMPQPLQKIALAVAKTCGIEGMVEHIPLDVARQQMGPVADCLAMDQKVGSTKAARFFGWSVQHPSVFDEIFSGSYLA